MSDEARSPFGDMVRTERRARKWTQARLASEATAHLPKSERQRKLTERSISAFEQKRSSPHEWISPRPSNVEAIAAAFGFARGTTLHQQLVEAAARTRERARSGEEASTPISDRSRFVEAGREEYLDLISARVARAINGDAQALAIMADSGAGKTWVLVEACRRAVSAYPELAVLWSSSSIRLGTPEPYQPFRQLLGAMIGGDRAPSPNYPISRENRRRLAARIPKAIDVLDRNGRDLMHRLLPATVFANDALEASPDLAPVVLSLMNHPAGQHGVPADESLLRVLLDYAQTGPLIMVVDDLHAADENAIRILASLTQRMKDSGLPLMVIGTYRPTFDHQPVANRLAPFQLAMERAYPDSVIDMTDAVQPASSQRFITALADSMGLSLSADEVREIQEQTLGLPIFVDGLLHLRNAREHGVSPEHVSSLTSHARILDAEIELLTSETRDALLAASVQGDTFSLDLLSKVVGMPADQLESLLNATPFWRRGLVHPATELSGPDLGTREYRFAHALMRDHLYQNILSDIERAHLHRLTADALASLEEDMTGDLNGLIAHHLEQAGESIPAAEAWLATGYRLVDHDEFEAAHFAFQRVRVQNIRLAAPRLEAEALMGLSICDRALDRHDDAKTWIEHGLEFASRRAIPDIEARLLSQLGMLAYDAGDVDRGTALVTRAIAIHERLGDSAEAARSLARLSHNLHGLGHYDEAISVAQRCIEVATSIGNQHMINAGQIALANCWLDLGKYEEAIALHRSTLRACNELGDIHRSNICLINLSLCEIERGDWQAALREQAPFTDRTRPVVPRFMSTVAFQWGLIAEGLGDLEDAERQFRTSLDVREHNGQSAYAIDSLAGLLRIATRQKDQLEIKRLLAEIDDRIERRGLDGVEHVARVCLAMMQGGWATGNQSIVSKYAATGLDYLEYRADLLANPADKQRYLEVVPTHRELLTLVASLPDDNDAGSRLSMTGE